MQIMFVKTGDKGDIREYRIISLPKLYSLKIGHFMQKEKLTIGFFL